MSDKEFAAFVILIKGGCCGKKIMTKSFNFTRVISNDPLDYINNKQVRILFDPRNEIVS